MKLIKVKNVLKLKKRGVKCDIRQPENPVQDMKSKSKEIYWSIRVKFAITVKANRLGFEEMQRQLSFIVSRSDICCEAVHYNAVFVILLSKVRVYSL